MGGPVRGREKHALEVFNEVVQYWGGLQKEGRIERFDVAILTPNGGDLGGLLLVRGTAAQIDSVRRSEDYQRLINHRSSSLITSGSPTLSLTRDSLKL